MDAGMLSNFDFLARSQREELYGELLRQVYRDMTRSGLEWEVQMNVTPEQLVAEVQKLLSNLERKAPSDLQQLLYLVDIRESDLHKAYALEGDARIALLSLLLLRRCWEKVHSRKKYG